MAENDAAAKLKARLNQWQEYVGDPGGTGERPVSMAPASPAVGATPEGATAVAPVHADSASPELVAGIRAVDSYDPYDPPNSDPQPAAGRQDECPFDHSCARPQEPPVRARNGTTKDTLIVERIDTVAAAGGSGSSKPGRASTEPRPPAAPYFDAERPTGGNGRRDRHGVYAEVDPRTRPVSNDRENRVNRIQAERQFVYARRVNAVLSVCVILLIALISCLVTFMLDR